MKHLKTALTWTIAIVVTLALKYSLLKVYHAYAGPAEHEENSHE